jgi:ABC-type Zn uptake system ZnuABC Zn-binding protein ZnuA
MKGRLKYLILIQNRIKTFSIVCGVLLFWQNAYSSVITTTTSIQSIVSELVPASIKVQSLAKDRQDPHHLEIQTHHIQMTKNAKLLVAVGFDFESAWLPKLLKASQPTIPTLYLGLKLSAPLEMGQSKTHNHHRFNPHFINSPSQVMVFVPALAGELQRVFPQQKDEIQKRFAAFMLKLNDKEKEWQTTLLEAGNKNLITYHESLEYFAKNYNLQIVDHVEEAHGVSPSPLHIKKLLAQIKEKQISCITYDSFYSSQQLEQIKKLFPKEIKWIEIPSEVGALKATGNYFSWQQTIVNNIASCSK